jgi:hypothetical protein
MKVTSNRAVLTVGLLSSVLVAICAISPDTLWVDEFSTWLLTRADSIPDWWSRFVSWPETDNQSPLYHFYMYEWTKVFGTDALAMRASNVGMFAIANLALLWPFRSRPTLAFPIILTACLSAPIWYYLNEVRPYIMLYAGTCLMVGATIEILGSRQRPSPFGIKALCVGAILSSGANVLGIAWAASTALFVLIYWLAMRRGSLSELINGNYFTIAITMLCITALITHDIRMFALGARPVLLHESNILTFLFSFYTNFGLLGVGPGMLDLRANGLAALVPFLPIIVFSALLFGLVVTGGLLEIRSTLGDRTIVLLIGCLLLPVLFIIALGLVMHWRVLPRHLIPLVPLFSLLLAFGLAWWWRHRLVGRALAVMFAIIIGYSSLSVRFASRHAKDDYKHAAELAAAELARDGLVWWVADPKGVVYYELPFVVEDIEWPQAQVTPHKVQIVHEKTFSFLSEQKSPTLVLLSRPDTYDQQNAVSNYLSVNKYHIVETFPAFTAWRR